jgi:two-component system cell cycle response regulator
MGSSAPAPWAPARALRVGPDKPTKTEMVAVRPEEAQGPPSPASRVEAPPKDSWLPTDLDDDDDVPTAMRDWNAEPNPTIAAVPRCPTLIRMDATSAGQTLALSDTALKLGRGREADVRVDDEGVSRLHAVIQRGAEGYEILDLGSRNGTVVSGRLIGRAVLRDGDVIQLGPRVAFRFSLMDTHQVEVMKQLFETSVRDGLTGAFNRQHLEDRLRGEIAYAVRHKTELGFLLLDVDHFKKVNDTYGHPAGDAVLRFVSGIVSSRLRTEDLFARYGGEEFVAVLRGIDLAGTARAGERLRTVIAANVPHFEGQHIPVTVSIGAASLSTCAEPTIESLVATADRRLYLAKNGGRNRVVASDTTAH